MVMRPFLLHSRAQHEWWYIMPVDYIQDLDPLSPPAGAGGGESNSIRQSRTGLILGLP